MNRINPPPDERLTLAEFAWLFISPAIGLGAAILILWLAGSFRCEGPKERIQYVATSVEG